MIGPLGDGSQHQDIWEPMLLQDDRYYFELYIEICWLQG